ncbi:MAG: DUF1574 domain-containing protein [Cyanobacteria bacterium REEB67]|nr:DUF1574 domain-containing protein [Cyanobacteria bacterium REEB67]
MTEATDLNLADEKLGAAAKTPPSAAWRTSFVLLGLLLFALADFSLRLVYHPDQLSSPYRSWIYAAVADYPVSGPKPDIVILGSSLMVAAVNDGDATTLGQNIDATTHHRSITLERALACGEPTATKKKQNKAAPPVRTQSFAIGGQMASDAYAILRALFGQESSQESSLNDYKASIKKRFVKPKLIVWGIAPRDFLDATFLDPYSSTTVTYLDKISSNHDALGTRKPYFWHEIEHFCDLICYSYDQREHLLVVQKDLIYRLLADMGLVSRADLGTVKTPQELLRIARRELPEDNGINQWVVKPQTSPITQFEDNSKEYTARYKPYKEKLFNSQLDYLQKFLLLAKGLGIKVVLVNMPLTPDNMALIPEGRYGEYLSKVQALSSQSQARFIDLNRDRIFTRQYFNDPVHLNGYGSQRFFTMVGKMIGSCDNLGNNNGNSSQAH